MEKNSIPDEMVKTTVNQILENYSGREDDLVAVLIDINKSLGFIPKIALDQVSSRMKLPKSRLFSATTFYSMLSTSPRGRHVVQFCENAPCHVVGGKQLFEALKDQLGLEPGETSEDGKWTLLTTSCIGVCSVGPVILIDDEIYGEVTPSRLEKILANYE